MSFVVLCLPIECSFPFLIFPKKYGLLNFDRCFLITPFYFCVLLRQLPVVYLLNKFSVRHYSLYKLLKYSIPTNEHLEGMTAHYKGIISYSLNLTVTLIRIYERSTKSRLPSGDVGQGLMATHEKRVTGFETGYFRRPSTSSKFWISSCKAHVECRSEVQ